ncbi:MAG: helix-turn-helix transcriptional regulator [Hungatella sp.]|nr:helix-turn-helix transcriptional regulator [Hungatella sp.]
MKNTNQRIKKIAEKATVLFLQQGYSRTQISHIAKAAGISVGTVYLDFTGKKEILHFILKGILEPDFADRKFEKPITEELFGDVEKELLKVFETETVKFEAHLGSTASYHFDQLISDTFDQMARYAVLCLFIRTNRWEFQALSEKYKVYRDRLLSAMTMYLTRYMALGVLRRLDFPELAATLIMENLSWWAMDRRYLSFETRPISMDEAKKVCMDNIMFAYRRG